MLKRTLPILLFSVTFLCLAAFLPAETGRDDPCRACHHCWFDPDLAEIDTQGGISMVWSDNPELFPPPVCFFWHACQGCTPEEEEDQDDADLALSNLLYEEDVTVSEWMKTNSTSFEFAIVEGTLEVRSRGCGKVLTWVPLDTPEETTRARTIIEQQ